MKIDLTRHAFFPTSSVRTKRSRLQGLPSMATIDRL
jgi:hypothetical protein